MFGSFDHRCFPKLSEINWVKTSNATRKYNCIAWAAGDTTRWWWPDASRIGYWPLGTPREETVQAFALAYGTLGYVQCDDASLEEGFEKIAIYCTHDADGLSPKHAAVQTEDGCWSSKLGGSEDIEHWSLDALDGPEYGTAICYLKRRRY